MSAAAQLMPDLARAIPAPAAIECLLDGGHVQLILPSPVRCQVRITLHGLEGVICRWCDPQDPADQPDTKDATMIVDERDHLRNGRSSSAAAKYALAFSRISLAWHSSRTSRSSSFAIVSRTNGVPMAHSDLSGHLSARPVARHRVRPADTRRASCPVNSQASAQSPYRLPCRWHNQHGSLGKAEHRVREARQDRRG